jgi:hypothetical protein
VQRIGRLALGLGNGRVLAQPQYPEIDQQALSLFPDYKFGISGNSSGFISTAGGGIIGVVVVCLIALIVGFLARQKMINKVK